MAKPSDKDPGKKPFIALSGKAVAGWVGVIFIISGWMFGVGVLVGRGTAPIGFDLDQLKRTLAALQKSAPPAPKNGPRPQPSEMKNKTELGFYESLPKNREDTDMPQLPKPAPVPPAAAKPEPAAPKAQEPPAAVKAEGPPAPAAAPPAPAAAAPGQVFTVQISAVKSEEEARRTTERLRQSGYAAHVEATSIPDKGTWYRVRMGEFPTRESARGTVERLKKDGFGSMVVPK